jgi:hypothetical protein
MFIYLLESARPNVLRYGRAKSAGNKRTFNLARHFAKSELRLVPADFAD